MIDAKHGQRIPSGRRMAIVLSKLFSAMRRHVFSRDDFNVCIFAGSIQDAVGPLIAVEYVIGQRSSELQHLEAITKELAIPRQLIADRARDISLRFVSDLAESTQRRARSIIATGIERGQSQTTIRKRLSKLFSKKRAANIAASACADAMWFGREDAAKASGAAGFEWECDEKACDVCKRLDGKRRRWGKPFIIIKGKPIYRPTVHPSCKCAVKEWYDRNYGRLQRR